MTWKIFPLLKFQISVVFVNTLTADENYAFEASGDFQFSLQLQLC